MSIFDSPYRVFAIALVAQALAAYAGDLFQKKGRSLRNEERQDFDILRTASLTLLGLLIGFSFAMAVSRYDDRKNFEVAEAKAIGTEYLRTDLLPAGDAAHVRTLLRQYISQRIAFYLAADERRLGQIDAETKKLQADLWSTVVRVATTQPTPMVALVVSGMNDVLNSQGDTQAAWLNRIPISAWALMILIAIACNLMLGYNEHRANWFLLILPFIVSISFFLIADIDSPRGGVIRVHGFDLIAQSQSMKPD
jgi:hypothetical protein